MDNVGFIGLGSMGRGMVANLARRGPVTVWDIDADACASAAGPQVEVAQNVATLGGGCNRLFLCLPDGGVVESVLFGETGVAPSLAPGTTVVDLSTTHADEARRFAARLAERDVAFLDAPVTGMETRAADGTLTIMVGGEAEAFAAVREHLEAMGALVLHMGASGSGQLMKTVNNVLYDVSVAAMAEMLPLAARIGLDPDKVRQVVGSGSGQSFGFDYFAPRVLAGRFTEGYPMSGAYKDLQVIAKVASDERAPMPVVSAAMGTFRQALSEGYGAEAKGAMVKVWERVLGVDLRQGRS